MADKQYYTKVSFEYGVDNGDGTFDVKNTGQLAHVSMDYQSAVMLQSKAILPGWQLMENGAMSLGELKAGLIENTPPGQLKR